MTPADETLPCPSCKARVDPRGDRCSKCGTHFERMCECGAATTIFMSRCASCQAPVLFRQKRWHFSKPAIAASALVLLAGGTVVGLWWHGRTTKSAAPWRARNAALDSYNRGQFEEAARSFEQLVEDDPTNALSWCLLADCRRRLGFDRATYRPLVDRAVAADPRLPQALVLLATLQREEGDLDGASLSAATAVQADPRCGPAYRILAEVELDRASPDLSSALESLERARAGGADSAQLRVRIAELRLRLFGNAPRDLYPAELTTALLLAEKTLAELGDTAEDGEDKETARARRALARARIKLALGKTDEALRALRGGVVLGDEDFDPQLRAQFLLARAQVMEAQGDQGVLLPACREALDVHPYQTTAAQVAEVLCGRAQDVDAVDVLRTAAAKADPAGGVNAVLTSLLLKRGDAAGAEQALAAARGAPGAKSSDVVLLLLDGDVKRAAGRLEEARTAYSDVVTRSPRLLEAKLRLADLALDVPSGRGARDAAVRAQIEVVAGLAAEHEGDPRAWRELGRLALAVGEAERARTALLKAVAASPSDADSWALLGDAWLGSDDGAAIENAARAYGRARAVRPHDASLVVAEARARLAASDPAGALATCTTYTRQHGDSSSEVLALRAQAQRALENWPAAAADLQKLLRAGFGDRTQVLSQALEAMFRAGRAEDARTLAALERETADELRRSAIDLLVSIHERGAEAAVKELAVRGPTPLLIDLQLFSGDVDAAIETGRRLLASEPANFAAARLLVTALVDGPTRSDERVAEARGVLSRLPDGAPPGLRELILGDVLLAEGKAVAAVVELRVAASERPGDPLARFLLGRALFETGERTTSLNELRTAASFPNAAPGARLVAAVRLLAASLEAVDPRRAESLAADASRMDEGLAGAALRYADLLHARGEFERAAEIAERSLSRPGANPAAAVALRRRAILSRCAAGQVDRALSHLQSLPAPDASDAVGFALRGWMELAVGRLDSAAKSLDASVDLEPAQPLALLGRVELALRRDKGEDAAELVRAWMQLRPDDAETPIAAARLFAQRRRDEPAIGIATAVETRAPANLAAARLSVRLLARGGRGAEALAHARRVAAAVAKPDLAEAQILLGTTLLRCGADAEGAAEVCRRVLAMPEIPDATERGARVLEAETLLARQKFDEAEAVAAELKRRWPDDAGMRGDVGLAARTSFVLGALAAHDGRWGAAAEKFGRCLDVVRDDVEAMNNLAWVLARGAGDLSRAVELAQRATELAPHDPNVWDTLATCSLKADRRSDAKESWRKALAIYAKSPRADAGARARTALALADLLRSDKEPDEARALAQGVLEYAKGTPEATRARSILEE